MPNLKNAKKRVLVNVKKEKANNEFAASMKTAIKNVERAVVSKDKEKANDKLKVAIKTIDKAAQKGVTAYLGNVQFVRKGEPLGGRSSATTDFANSTEEDFL